jgi:hypothetical protein
MFKHALNLEVCYRDHPLSVLLSVSVVTCVSWHGKDGGK